MIYVGLCDLALSERSFFADVKTNLLLAQKKLPVFFVNRVRTAKDHLVSECVDGVIEQVLRQAGELRPCYFDEVFFYDRAARHKV